MAATHIGRDRGAGGGAKASSTTLAGANTSLTDRWTTGEGTVAPTTRTGTRSGGGGAKASTASAEDKSCSLHTAGLASGRFEAGVFLPQRK